MPNYKAGASVRVLFVFTALDDNYTLCLLDPKQPGKLLSGSGLRGRGSGSGSGFCISLTAVTLVLVFSNLMSPALLLCTVKFLFRVSSTNG
jgi:hypothetical protein